MKNWICAAVLTVRRCTVATPAPALGFPDRGRAGVVDAAHVPTQGEHASR